MHPEHTTLERARRFDESALAEIYDQHSPGIYRYAWRLLGDVDLAEECVAETFRRYLEALRRGGGPHQYLKAYLYRVAHNWISDYYRRESSQVFSLEDIQLADPENEPSKAAQMQAQRQVLRQALAGLTPDQRQVIVLKYLEGWSNAEISQALARPLGAVKALAHRGLHALRKHFDENSEMIA
jgi:RNA polymerase sigma-70 factor (ECF subfamily)